MRDNQTKSTILYNLRKNKIMRLADLMEVSTGKNTFQDNSGDAIFFEIIIDLFKNYKPFQFFGSVSMVLLIAAIILFIPVFAEYLNTGLVLRFPTLIVCGFMVIAALLSFSSGIILDTLVQKHKQDFEFRLYITEKTWRELHKEDITRAECSVRNLVLENQYTGE